MEKRTTYPQLDQLSFNCMYSGRDMPVYLESGNSIVTFCVNMNCFNTNLYKQRGFFDFSFRSDKICVIEKDYKEQGLRYTDNDYHHLTDIMVIHNAPLDFFDAITKNLKIVAIDRVSLDNLISELRAYYSFDSIHKRYEALRNFKQQGRQKQIVDSIFTTDFNGEEKLYFQIVEERGGSWDELKTKLWEIYTTYPKIYVDYYKEDRLIDSITT